MEENPTPPDPIEVAAHDVVKYHQPDQAGIDAITNIRNATENLIITIMRNCPGGADRTAAIRKARETMMTANAAIVIPTNAVSMLK